MQLPTCGISAKINFDWSNFNGQKKPSHIAFIKEVDTLILFVGT